MHNVFTRWTNARLQLLSKTNIDGISGLRFFISGCDSLDDGVSKHLILNNVFDFCETDSVLSPAFPLNVRFCFDFCHCHSWTSNDFPGNFLDLPQTDVLQVHIRSPPIRHLLRSSICKGQSTSNRTLAVASDNLKIQRNLSTSPLIRPGVHDVIRLCI